MWQEQSLSEWNDVPICFTTVAIIALIIFEWSITREIGKCKNTNVLLLLTNIDWWYCAFYLGGEEGKTLPSWKWVKEGDYYDRFVFVPSSHGSLFWFLPIPFEDEVLTIWCKKNLYYLILIQLYHSFNSCLPDWHNLPRIPMIYLGVLFPKLCNSLLWVFAKIAFTLLIVNCELNKVRRLSHCCGMTSNIYYDICFHV